MSYTYPDAETVWQILVEEAGAYPGDLTQFVYHWPDCREYRFIGRLGFGGKVWANQGRVYVTCYREDETPEREAMIVRCAQRLDALSAHTSQ